MHRGLIWIAAALAIAGCEAVPRTGPTGDAVRAAADGTGPTAVAFAFAPIAPETLEALEARRTAPPRDLDPGRPATGPRLSVGDAVTVTIWEAVEGGLFSNPGGAGASLPSQRVGPSGAILVPYAGRISAAGKTPEEVAASVTEALEGKAIEPQVLVTVDASPVSSVTVIGDAATQSGRVPIEGVGERVLDVIAASGGASVPAHRTRVRLTRGDATGETHLSRILNEPSQNVRVRAGDVITLQDSQRSYIMLGAAERPSRVPFSTEVVTLDQAIAEAGGLRDNRADPGAVYVFRYEDPAMAAAITGVPREEIDATPMIFSLNLRDPGAFFLAQRFEMADDDVIYVANAPLADAQKVLATVALAVSPVLAVSRFSDEL